MLPKLQPALQITDATPRRSIRIFIKSIGIKPAGTTFVYIPHTMNDPMDRKSFALHPRPDVLVSLMEEFTDTHKASEGMPAAEREARCDKVQWKARVRSIRKHDLLAGRMVLPPIGFAGQTDGSSMGYYLNGEAMADLRKNPGLSKEKLEKLDGLTAYWRGRTTEEKAKKAYPLEMQQALPSDLYCAEPGIAFTLWRMAGIQLNYNKLIDKGIDGLKREITALKEEKQKDGEARSLYAAMLTAIETFSEVSHYYADMAEDQVLSCDNLQRRRELGEMAGILRKISKDPPGTFTEALQLMFLYSMLDGTRNYGRMDDYLGRLFAADVDSGRLDEEEAIRLLSGLWMLMRDRDYRYDTRVVIGGRGRKHEQDADRLAMVIMETTHRVREIVPQLALRFYRGQAPALYQKALDIIGSGYTYPMLYNDDVNIPAVSQALDIPPEEAIHAIQYGCGEYVLNHRSVGTPSGVINLLQALIVTLNRGTDPVSGKAMGMPPERFDKYGGFDSFKVLLDAYREQVEYHVEQLARHEELEYVQAGRENAYLYTSMLMDDCLERGRAIFSGGIRYLGGTLETYGNVNTSDSLLAIRELVYEKKRLDIAKLVKILNANFKGYAKERQWMLECPKYGNDDDAADEMMIFVHNHICNFTREQKRHTSLHSYLVVIINNDANTVMGKYTGASPDGRMATTYMNPGNNPVGGMDRNGVTAFLNSILKPDPSIHAGAVQNMKFSKALFRDQRHILEALLNTYFRQGGTQAMLTVISRGDLEEAIKHPEKYANLMVRVGGFSERFVDLPPETQQEILSRTLY
jgi:pyruvate-formate lyase